MDRVKPSRKTGHLVECGSIYRAMQVHWKMMGIAYLRCLWHWRISPAMLCYLTLYSLAEPPTVEDNKGKRGEEKRTAHTSEEAS